MFLALIVAVFFLARRLFDGSVAWLTAFLLLGTEIFWRYCVSGLSTVLLMLIFVGLAWALVLLEEELREPKWGQAGVFVLTGAGGLIVGLGGLTRYSFGWLILPVVFFVVLHSTGARRVYLPLLACGRFPAAVMSLADSPNEHVSGTPFGTAGYSVMEDTVLFPGDRLPRSLEPDFARDEHWPVLAKLLINARQDFQNELPRTLGGTWMVALFATGLLVNFRSLSLRRLRAFLLASMALLFVVEAYGPDQYSGRGLRTSIPRIC